MTKTAAANLTSGMTIKVSALEDLTVPTGYEALDRLNAENIAKYGVTHEVPCGTVRQSSPVVTIAKVEWLNQKYQNLNSLLLETTGGERFKISSRQKVEVVG
jgi:hypothetical protein